MTKKLLLALTALLALSPAALALSPAALASPEWPTFKFDPARQGSAPGRHAIRKPKLLWKAPVGIAGWLNSPVIADGTVFVGSGGYLWNLPDHADYADTTPTDGVYAFDLDTGVRKWFTPAENDVNSVALVDGKLIATGDEGAIWALDPASGRRLWQTRLEGAGFQLLPHGKQVLVGDSEGQLAWVDAASGQIAARTRLDGAIRAGASSDGKNIYTATTRGSVYAFDARGHMKWRQSLQDLYPEHAGSEGALAIYAAPTLYKDLVVLGFARDSYYESPALLALEARSGKLRWKSQPFEGKSEWGNVRTSPAIYRDRLIYAEPYSNVVVAINGDTGKAEGGSAVGAPMFPQWSSPAIAENIAYVPRFDGGLYALDAGNGQPIWSFYLGIPSRAGSEFPPEFADLQDPEWKPLIGDAIYASPALAADGRILIPAAGFLYCIGEE